MHTIVRFFVQNFDNIRQVEVPVSIKKRINQLDRAERGELRNQLFERAKLLGQTKPTEQITDWLQGCFQVMDQFSFHYNRVFFSPGNGIKESIMKLLRDARSTVDLCVFTITDAELAHQILDCHRRKVRIRIITDDEKIMDDGSEIFRLQKNGIAIKTDHSHYHMHNKFGILDRRVAITGSFNWTYTATRHNQENMLATSKHEIVKQYQAEFDRLWDEMFVLR